MLNLTDTEKYNLYETQQRLRYWAAWCNDILAMGLGYHRKNMIELLRETQGDVIKSTNTHLVIENAEAEIIDALLSQYAVKHKEEAKILTRHYLSKDKIADKIAHSKLPKSTYHRYVREAELWIMRRLFAKNT